MYDPDPLNTLSALWVTATVAGGFSLLVSIINAFFRYRQTKKQHDFNKQLEKYKDGIDNKTYMCKTKFDAEFSMYRELSQAFTVLVKECSQLFPNCTSHRIFYEDSHLGRITNDNFIQLIDKYQSEQEQLLGQIETLENALQEVKDSQKTPYSGQMEKMSAHRKERR